MSKALKVVVIGAGICGLSSAIWLRRAGHDVVLIDKDGPGAGASYGNAGLLAQWAVVPVNTPDLPKTAFKYLLNPKAPLFLKWRSLPRMTPWLWAFLRNARTSRTGHMVDGIANIVTDSVDQHRALTRGTRAESWISESDFSFVYPSIESFKSDRTSWGLRAGQGFEPELITGPAVQEAEPILSPSYQCLAVLKDHGHILNPGAYLQALAEVLADEGGQYRQAEALDLTFEGGQIAAVETDQGSLPCDRLVLAAGIWSKSLMKKVGLRVQLAAERGYHLHFKDPSIMPRNPMMMSKAKFGVNPMASGLRCAGTVELGDEHAARSRAPLELIGRHVKSAFPTLRYSSAEEWLGFRPSTPDSLPLIGEIGRTGMIAAFGHQHIGLTAGPKTGRIVSNLISDQPPNLDLAPYDANRFL